jgi:hypothetical protein
VKLSVVCSSALASTNSFSVNTKEISATTASTGAARGSTTPQNTCDGVAPSTRADSSSSFGIVSKKPFISQQFTPSAPPRYTSTSPVFVFRPNAGKTSLVCSMIR